MSQKFVPAAALASEDWRQRARALQRKSLGFRDCPPAVLDELLALGQVRTLARGEYMHHAGDDARSVWLLIEGALEASLLHADGQRHLLGLALPGDFIGLQCLVDELPEYHDVLARESCVAVAYPINEFRQLRLREPGLVRACERQIVARMRLMSERLAGDSAVPLDVRTAHMLRMLADQYGEADDGGGEVTLRLPQTDLADWLGNSRQRTNFALKQLEAEGVIRLRYGAITIVDRQALGSRARS